MSYLSRPLLRFCFALLAVLANPQILRAQETSAREAWVTLPALPDALTDIQAAAANGKLYVFGGLDGARSKGVVLEFDTANATWSRKKPMPLAAHHMAITSYGDRIYLFGGFRTPEKSGGWQPIDNAWEYDPANDTWKALKALPSKRGGALAAARDGKFYVIGGAAAAKDSTPETLDAKRRHDVLAQVDEYDLKSDSWRSRAPMPTPRALAQGATIIGKIYVIGGRVGSLFANGSETDIVEAYDAATDSWSAPLERMPTPRAAEGSGVWRNMIVVAGQDAKEPRAGSQAVEAYDPGLNKWRAFPALPAAQRGFAAAAIGDRLHVVGGETIGGTKPESAGAAALQLDAVK